MIYPWQQNLWQQILKNISQKKLSSALLLIGPTGIGKYELARHIAAKIFCERDEVEPCGVCRGCHLYAKGNHPDFFDIGLEEKSKAIKIDKIRFLINKLQNTPQYAEYQVVIIHPADTLNRASANALLKTLEEPPGKVFFILSVEQPGRLPATIISRCQRFTCVLQDEKLAIRWLQQKTEATPELLALALRLAYGAPLQALKLIENNILDQRNYLLAQLQQILDQQQNPVVAAENVLQKEEINLMLSLWLSIAEDLLRLQLGAVEIHVKHQDQIKLFSVLAQRINVLSLQKFIINLFNVRKLLNSSLNPNVQLQLEKLWIEWGKLGQV